MNRSTGISYSDCNSWDVGVHAPQGTSDVRRVQVVAEAGEDGRDAVGIFLLDGEGRTIWQVTLNAPVLGAVLDALDDARQGLRLVSDISDYREVAANLNR